MPKNKTFDQQLALEAAMLAFWEYGYEGTSLKILEDKMGLKRTSIYNAFGNKRELFEQTITLYQQTVFKHLLKELERSESIHDRFQFLFNAVIKLHYSRKTPGGCLVALSLLETALHNQSSKRLLKSALGYIATTIEDHLIEAQTQGDILKSTDTKALAWSLVAIMSGIVTQAQAGVSKRQLTSTVTTAIRLIA
jgi:TetR/AcrR family transcriptional repressor of nem operon